MGFWSTFWAVAGEATVILALGGACWAAMRRLLLSPKIMVEFHKDDGPDTQLYCTVSNPPLRHWLLNPFKIQREEIKVRARAKIRYLNGANYLPEYENGYPLYFFPEMESLVLDHHTIARIILISESVNVANQLILGSQLDETEDTPQLLGGRFQLIIDIDCGARVISFSKNLAVSGTDARWLN